MTTYDSATMRVLEAGGGVTAVARFLGIGPSAVAQWTKVPAVHVPKLEALTGIPGKDIRPDMYKGATKPVPSPPVKPRPRGRVGPRGLQPRKPRAVPEAAD